MYRSLSYVIFLSLGPSISAQPLQQLIDSAATLPPMPRESMDLVPFTNGIPTFSSGTPFNDLEYTLFDTDYMEGETHGFDQFMPVDPADPLPGSDRVKLVRGTSNVDIDAVYLGAKGDRIILGTHEAGVPFFLRGTDGLDNDYAVVQNFDFNVGYIQLQGAATDYQLFYCTLADGCTTEGYYLYYTAGGAVDLVAFIYPCWDLGATISGNPPQNPTALCNGDSSLSLTDPDQFRFALPLDQTIAQPTGVIQHGSAGKEIVGGIWADAAHNTYLFGLTDGNLDNGADAANEVFISKIDPSGTVLWTTELASAEGTLLMDAVDDGTHLYVCGRTLGALPGFTGAGRWDGILLKLQLTDGTLVDSDQWGNEGMDGYGNIVLDDADHLFVSGQGSPPGMGGTDDVYLVAKHNTSDLNVVWRALTVPTGAVLASSEAWGGLSYDAGTMPGDGRLVAAGWYMATGGAAQGFVDVYEDLNAAAPTVAHQVVVASTGQRADWVLDNAVDSQGNIYVVGFTTGNLGGPALGEGDAYIAKYAPDLTAPLVVKVGTSKADAFRKLVIDANDHLYALGYTYGDLDGTNADPAQGSADVMIRKYDTGLNLLVGTQFGTPHEDRGTLTLRDDRLHIGGTTEASFCGTSFGSFDAFALVLDTTDLSVLDLSTGLMNAAGAPSRPVVYPVPARDVLYLPFAQAGTIRDVRLFAVDGREWPVVRAGNTLLLGSVPPGQYVLRLMGTEGSFSMHAVSIVR